MKKLKTTTLILILVLVSLLSNVFAQKDVIHYKTANNKFGKYDEKKDTNVYDIFNNSQVDVYLTKDAIYIVDTGKGVLKFSELELVKKAVIDNSVYIYLKAEDKSDPNDIKACLFGFGFDKNNNLGGIYLTNYTLSCYLNIQKTINNYDYTIENLIAGLPKYDETAIAKSP